MQWDKLEFVLGGQDKLEDMYQLSKVAMKEQVEEIFGPWDEDQQREMFFRSTHPNTHTLLYFQNRLIGYYWFTQTTEHTHLHRITLHPEIQGKGLGTRLLQKLMKESKEMQLPMQLRVFPSNPAYRLYRRLGFKEFDRTDKHIYMRWVSE